MSAAATKAFTSAINKASKGADRKALAPAVAALVSKRLRRLAKPKLQPWQEEVEKALANKASTQAALTKRARRTSRRSGRNQYYTATSKVDVSRLGTFRHYMLSTIRAHTNSWDAEAAHALCDVEAFRKNKLSFSWAAAEGYITFD